MAKLVCPKCGRWLDDDVDAILIDMYSIDVDDVYELEILNEVEPVIWLWRCSYCKTVVIKVKVKSGYNVVLLKHTPSSKDDEQG